MSEYVGVVVPPEWAGKPIIDYEAGWPVIKRFEPEAGWRAGLADLSHRPKAIAHGPGLSAYGGIGPGRTVWTGWLLACGLGPDEAMVFNLAGSPTPEWPDGHHTDLTEAWALLALIGPEAVAVAQRLIALDVDPPGDEPFSLATGIEGIGVVIARLRGRTPGLLIGCERSYGQVLYDLCFTVGRHLGLRPVGDEAFQDWRRGVRLEPWPAEDRSES